MAWSSPAGAPGSRPAAASTTDSGFARRHPRHFRQHGLEDRRHLPQLSHADDDVPRALELLPAGRVGKVLGLMLPRFVGARRASDRRPAVELAVGPVISGLEGLRRQACRPVDDVARVVEVPVPRRDPALRFHLGVEARPRIRRLDVERRGRDALLHGPVHRAPEHVLIVIVHPEDKAAIDHDAEIVQPFRDRRVVTAEILPLVAGLEVGRASASRTRRTGCGARHPRRVR